MDTKVTPSSDTLQDLRINGARLWNSLMELAQIGATPKGGVCRLALTEADGRGDGDIAHRVAARGCAVARRVRASGQWSRRRPTVMASRARRRRASR